MNDQEITQHAERIASGWPSRPATAPRERFPCTIAALEADGAALQLRVRLDSPILAASLRRPGQYTTLALGELAPRFGVIAQAPGERDDAWDFLISRDSTLGRALASCAVGDPISLTEAEGPGFDMQRLDGEPLLVFATGSAIAAARPVIQHLLRERPQALARCAVYYGERRWDAFSYKDELARWIGAGCAVWRVCELTEDGAPTALHSIQQAFARDAQAMGDLGRAVALLAGSPPMLRAVSVELMTRGLPSERILTNM